MKKILKRAFSVFLVVLMLLSTAPIDSSWFAVEANAAGVAGYNASAAVAWAKAHVYDTWSCLYGQGYWEPDTGDCANFVSQCIYMGGLDQNASWNHSGYKAHYSTSSDGTWIRAKQLHDYVVSLGGVEIRNPSASQISIGDLIFYYDSSVGRFRHSAIVVDVNGNTVSVAAHSTNYDCYISNDFRLGRSGNDVYLVKMYGRTCTNSVVRDIDVYTATGSSAVYSSTSTSSTKRFTFFAGEYAHIYQTKTVNGVVWGYTCGYSATKGFFYGWVKISTLNINSKVHVTSTAADHKWNSGTVTKNPTCTVTGTRQYTCTVCGATKTSSIPATGHKVVAATCTNRSYCSKCDATISNALGHNFPSSWTTKTAATCTGSGIQTKTCSRCQAVKTNTLAKLGHNMGSWYIVREATCTLEGIMRRDCSRCTYSEIKNIALKGHSYGNEEIVSEPTCTQAGTKKQTCADCGVEKSYSYGEPLGHDMGEWYVYEPATDTTPGIERSDCSRCDYCLEREIAEHDHEYGEWAVITAPTCTEDGYKYRICSVCLYNDTETTVATGHRVNVVEIGSYPQSKVEDEDTLASLNELLEDEELISYEYYYGNGEAGSMVQGDYMKYADVELGGEMYRYVEIESSRPISTLEPITFHHDSANYVITEPAITYQRYNDYYPIEISFEEGYNGYSFNLVNEAGYWFKYEPIEWRVLDQDSGLVLCETIVDAQPYSATIYEVLGEDETSTYYGDEACTAEANNYANSSIREWLNADFYNTAFNDEEKAMISTSEVENDNGTVKDKIFLLSYDDVTDIDYYFDESADNLVTRKALTTDYAQSQGARASVDAEPLSIDVFGTTTFLYAYDDLDEAALNNWWLRTPTGNSSAVKVVDANGNISDNNEYSSWEVTDQGVGVRPAMRVENIKILREDTAATCTEPGHIGNEYCYVCDELLMEGYDTEVLGHNFIENENLEPTCTEDGYITEICTRCELEQTSEVLDALGHDMCDWYVISDPTCTQEGEEERTCMRGCGYTETQAIEALGHSGVYEEDVVATCEQDGYYGAEICEVCDVTLVERVIISATGHSGLNTDGEEVWVTEREAGCDVTGLECLYCQNEWCDYNIDCENHTSHYYLIKSREIEAIKPNFAIVEHKEPTCTELGYDIFSCLNCIGTENEHEWNEILNYTDHIWSEPTVVYANCTQGGHETVTCTYCGLTETYGTDDAVGHALSPKDEGYNESDDKMELISSVENACGSTTVDTYQCTHIDKNTSERCTYTVVIGEEKDHTIGDYVICIDPTCTEEGYQHKECADCDYETSDEVIDAIGHDWDLVETVEPTCTEQGYDYYVCKNDSSHEWYDYNTSILGHNMGSWTENEDGTHTRECQRENCDYSVTEDCIFGDWVTTKEPTCYEKGEQERTCLVCGYVETAEIELIEHKADEAVEENRTDPWCEEDGEFEEVVYCTECGEELSRETITIEAIGHDWDDGVIDPESTCNTHGTITYTCQNDNSHIYTAAVDYDPDNHVGETYLADAKEETCTEDGYTGDTYCSDCDAILESGKTIPAHGHDYQKIEEKSVAPDYGVAGYDYYECSYDASHNYKVDIEPLVKTTYTATFIVTAPFFTQDKTVGTVVFEQGDKYVEEPAVENYSNYTFVWDEYELKDEDIVIYGRYTEIELDSVTDLEGEKSAELLDNGVVNITLEARADSKNIKILSQNTKPVDVVLVLDQSGSMDAVLSSEDNVTKRDALVGCANDFVNEVYENALATGADHRIAVVGFAYSSYNGGEYKNTGILATTAGKSVNYDDLGNFDYSTALIPVVDNGTLNANITNGINSVQNEGATAADLGLEMAKNIFASTEKEANRERIVIFITDGTPTSWGESTDLVKSTAAAAITEANSIKNEQGAKIYSIGVHADADPTAEFTSDTYGVATDSRDNFVSYDFNRFLHAVSSNYPDAASIKVSEMGEGSKNSGYYMAVNDTSKLSEIFSKILYSSVYEIKTFDKVTLTDTISKEFTLTLEQETKMRENLISELGIKNEDITVIRNADGTTTVRFENVRATKVYNADGSSYYSAKVSFNVSADEDSVGLRGNIETNTEDAGIEINGEIVEKFDIPTVTLEQSRNIIIFTINGVTYRIDEADLGDKIVAPESDLAQWNIPEGTVVENSCSVFEADVIDSTEYTVTWVSEGTSEVQTYTYGRAVIAPEAAEKEGYDFLKWTPSVPATMPNYNITFTAVYTPEHTHEYSVAYTTGKCTEGVTTVYECACGDSYEETAGATDHICKAIIQQTDNGTLIEQVICDVCGTTNSQSLTYTVSYRTGKNSAVLDLTLYENEISVQPDGTITIRFYIGEDIDKYNYTVYRIDENGKKTSYTPTKENGYLVFEADHFSFYVVAIIDEATGEPVDDVSYGDAYCTINGHSYTSKVTAPTCTAVGYTTHTCGTCGDSYKTDETAAIGHSYTSKVTAPTCTSEGYTTYTCGVCGDSYRAHETAKSTHNYSSVVTVATCTSHGYTTYTCKVCAYSYTGNRTDATGHSIDSDGKCTVCGYDNTSSCSCNCHKSGIAGFFFKLILFFQKIFRTNQTCRCGIRHY